MNTNARTSTEVYDIFTSKGCTVKVHSLGHSYRAGGEIFIYAPSTNPSSEDGFNFAPAQFDAFDPTGYDGRGRHYAVYVVTEGDYVRATAAEYHNAAEDRRVSFGNESDLFVHRDELRSSGLADLANAFAALGL